MPREDQKKQQQLCHNTFSHLKSFSSGFAEIRAVSSTLSVAIPTCLPSGSQSAAANTMVAILHDYTNSQVRRPSWCSANTQSSGFETIAGRRL